MFLLRLTTAGQEEGDSAWKKISCRNLGIYKEVTKSGSAGKATSSLCTIMSTSLRVKARRKKKLNVHS